MIAALIHPIMAGLALASILFFLRAWRSHAQRKKTNPVRFIAKLRHPHGFIIPLDPFMSQKISLLVATFIFSLVGLTASGAQASVVEALSVLSDNPAVLAISPNTDGTFTVTVVGVGTCNLIVTTQEDLLNGIPAISQSFAFEVYDSADEATHFSMSISDIVEKPMANADAAATSTTASANTAAADPTTTSTTSSDAQTGTTTADSSATAAASAS